jgi:hypothetical protein
MEQELTPELLRQLYPQVYWVVYRRGFAECRTDATTQKLMAEEYLKSTVLPRAAASPTTALRPSSSPAPALTISAEQVAINTQLGLTEGDFLKYHNAGDHREI